MLKQKFIAHVLKHDSDNIYRRHIEGKTASAINSDVAAALRIAFKSLDEVDNLRKNAGFEKESKNFLNKLVIKTLKIAQASLAVLLFKTPFRVAVAYNALHWCIKYLQEQLDKTEPKKK